MQWVFFRFTSSFCIAFSCLCSMISPLPNTLACGYMPPVASHLHCSFISACVMDPGVNDSFQHILDSMHVNSRASKVWPFSSHPLKFVNKSGMDYSLLEESTHFLSMGNCSTRFPKLVKTSHYSLSMPCVMQQWLYFPIVTQNFISPDSIWDNQDEFSPEPYGVLMPTGSKIYPTMVTSFSATSRKHGLATTRDDSMKEWA